MEPSGVKFPFEFCALRYFLQWRRKEEDLHASMKKGVPGLPEIRRALRYFQVARNFKGLKQDDRAELVRSAILDVRADSNLSPEQKVATLAQLFKEAGFQHNISAASKLLWLSSRSPFVIYDSRAHAALEDDFGFKADKKDYEAYCLAWRKAYKLNQQAILDAVNKLPNIRAFLPGSTPADGALLALVNKNWFRERVFDIYLWEIGGDGDPEA